MQTHSSNSDCWNRNESQNCQSKCRLCPTFASVARLPLATRSFAHRVRPDWPLCPYELRGSCRDTKCSFQMNVDTALNNVELLQHLQDLAGRCAPF